MSLNPHIEMTFEKLLNLLLNHPSAPLPPLMELGIVGCRWLDGKFGFKKKAQKGFRKMTPDELKQVMRRLQAAPHVIILLNLEAQCMGCKMIQEIAGHITALSNLQVLGLGGNDIRTIGCAALAESLPHLSALQVLVLSENSFDKPACLALSTSLVHLTHLQHLDLGNSSIGDVGCEVLSPSLVHLTRLQHLDFSKNYLSGHGFKSLWSSLVHLTRLQYLGLGSNNTDRDSVCRLVPFLLNMPLLGGGGTKGRTGRRGMRRRRRRRRWSGKRGFPSTIMSHPSSTVFTTTRGSKRACLCCLMRTNTLNGVHCFSSNVR
jgi:hypothetical protein